MTRAAPVIGAAPATMSPPRRRIRVLDERRSSPLSGDVPTAVWFEIHIGEALPIVLIDGSWQPIAAFRTPQCAARYLNAGFGRPNTLPQAVLDRLNELL